MSQRVQLEGNILYNILYKVHIVHCIHVLLLLANLVLPFSFLKLLPTPSNVPSVVTAHNDETNCAAGRFFPWYSWRGFSRKVLECALFKCLPALGILNSSMPPTLPHEPTKFTYRSKSFVGKFIIDHFFPGKYRESERISKEYAGEILTYSLNAIPGVGFSRKVQGFALFKYLPALGILNSSMPPTLPHEPTKIYLPSINLMENSSLIN